ncbi:hypothetical protein [Enterococcus timonensis]|uniref:hypothetical protein n=1 Tax=Enterococcus timonensis TaxID=1852364 RepID=UPI0008D8E9B2|nr:hypothetical protein [Enterococcus timonensis]
MKTSTKVILGVTVAGAVVASGAILSVKFAGEKFAHAKKRHQVKGFVRDKLDGNEKIMAMVDKLSDEDLDHVTAIAGKVKDSKDHISVYGNALKENTQDLKDKLVNFVEDLM